MNEAQKIMRISELALKCFSENFESYGKIMHFPKNYCEEASSILLLFLRNDGIDHFELIKGTDLLNNHHFWLQSHDYIIDLTAHQFEGIEFPYIFLKRTDYPLTNKFVVQKNVSIDDNWQYLKTLTNRIKKIFYEKYYA